MLIVLSATSLNCLASGHFPSSRIPTTFRFPKNPSRPNAPSKVEIECYYEVGYMELSLPEGVEELTVTLYQNGLCVYYGVATPEASILEIPELIGEVEVECVDTLGRRYVGTILF